MDIGLLFTHVITGRGFAPFFLVLKLPSFLPNSYIFPIIPKCFLIFKSICIWYSPPGLNILNTFIPNIYHYIVLYIYIYILNYWRLIIPQRCMFCAPLTVGLGCIYIFNWPIVITPSRTALGVWLILCVSLFNL